MKQQPRIKRLASRLRADRVVMLHARRLRRQHGTGLKGMLPFLTRASRHARRSPARRVPMLRRHAATTVDKYRRRGRLQRVHRRRKAAQGPRLRVRWVVCGVKDHVGLDDTLPWPPAVRFGASHRGRRLRVQTLERLILAMPSVGQDNDFSRA